MPRMYFNPIPRLECILASRTETSLHNQIPKYFAIKNREIVIAIFEAGNCCTSYN